MTPIDWTSKTVFITGGTGSFGKKLTRIMLQKHHPKKLIIFSRDELKQHEMRLSGLEHPSLRYFVGDIRNLHRLRRAMDGVDIIIHAAAMKQVPACEYNPFEAVMSNVLGTQNVISAAIDCEVQSAIVLSSDKAVEPVNLYGATKLAAEKLFVHGNVYSKKTRFSATRYGNVRGSRGSVIPIFLKQRKTGTLTITDKRMTRFWISLPDAVAFVIQRLSEMAGGEVFVPKIPSIQITDLAAAIAPKAKLEVIGIRPGEKLHESLISANEAHRTFDWQDFYVILPSIPWSVLDHWRTNPVPPTFQYSSNTNSEWLSQKDLRKMME